MTLPTSGGPTVAALRRVIDAREHVHSMTCPRPLDKDPHGASQCVLGVSPFAIAAVLDYLDQRPRDARGARRILHDAVCASGCTGDQQQDHADRTQTTAAAALRRFRVEEERIA